MIAWTIGELLYYSYLLGSHDVELEEVEGTSVLLGVERIVDHEVRSD
jgi:hypothetical protein